MKSNFLQIPHDIGQTNNPIWSSGLQRCLFLLPVKELKTRKICKDKAWGTQSSENPIFSQGLGVRSSEESFFSNLGLVSLKTEMLVDWPISVMCHPE